MTDHSNDHASAVLQIIAERFDANLKDSVADSNEDAAGKAPHHDLQASNTVTLRLRMPDHPESLGTVTMAIGKLGLRTANFGNFCLVDGSTECDISVYLNSSQDRVRLIEALSALDGVKVRNASDPVELAHLGGKIEVVARRPVRNNEDLSRIYTPGVARICRSIQARKKRAYDLTMKGNTILVVSDCSRVLSLGNVAADRSTETGEESGAEAGLPVMEGKCVLFGELGNVNAFPIVLDTQDAEEIIRTVQILAPGVGGINLEDIESPKCWYVERRLKELLDIPVFHDDQHGTAVVVLAGTYNAARFVGKKLRDMRIVVSGVGAAGMACCKLLIRAGARNLIGFKKEGAIYRGRQDMNDEEVWLSRHSNREGFQGTLKQAMHGADMFLGLSAAGVINPDDVKNMADQAIVFALANPVPEVDPWEALKYARVVATGGSEFPNQINNALAFPGIFRGALDARVRDITERMQLEAARALARVIKPSLLRAEKIIPEVFDKRAHEAVAEAVRRIAHKTGKARRDLKIR